MIEDKHVCPHCGEPLHRRPYLMAMNPDAPGLIDSLRGEGGEPWRLFVTIALCVIAVLIISGVMVAVKHLQ